MNFTVINPKIAQLTGFKFFPALCAFYMFLYGHPQGGM
jgi:hypothetical protein